MELTSIRKQSDRDRSHLRKKMTDRNLPNSLTPFIYSFFYSTCYYAHIFISEVFDGLWTNFNDDDSWTSNELHSTTRSIRNWRERSIPKINFMTISKVWPENLSTIDVSNLETVNVGASFFKLLYNAIRAFYPVYPYQSSFLSELCSFLDESFRKFISDAVLSIV